MRRSKSPGPIEGLEVGSEDPKAHIEKKRSEDPRAQGEKGIRGSKSSEARWGLRVQLEDPWTQRERVGTTEKGPAKVSCEH